MFESSKYQIIFCCDFVHLVVSCWLLTKGIKMAKVHHVEIELIENFLKTQNYPAEYKGLLKTIYTLVGFRFTRH